MEVSGNRAGLCHKRPESERLIGYYQSLYDAHFTPVFHGRYSPPVQHTIADLRPLTYPLLTISRGGISPFRRKRVFMESFNVCRMSCDCAGGYGIESLHGFKIYGADRRTDDGVRYKKKRNETH